MAGGPAVASYAHLLDPEPWYKNRRLILLNLWIGILFVLAVHRVSIFSLHIASETPVFLDPRLLQKLILADAATLMNGLQSLPQWIHDFHNPTGGLLGLLNAIQNVGSLCAIPFSPYMADGLGRRSNIIFGTFIVIAATFVQTASQNVHMFIGARWLIGFGLTFSSLSASLLTVELAYPSHRSKVTSLYNTMLIFGSIVAAWTTFGTFRITNSWAWRTPSATQGIASLILMLAIWFIPESPRWLMSKGRDTKALHTLAYYHAKGNEKNPLVEFEFREIKAALDVDRRMERKSGWLSLIKTSGNRRRMRIIVAIAVFSEWSGNGLTYNYLHIILDGIGIRDTTTQLLINGLLQIFSFLICVLSAFICDRVGRRRLFLISTGGMLILSILETILFSVYSKTGVKAVGNAFIAMIFLFTAFYSLGYPPLIVTYTVEILPSSLRSKGLSVFVFSLLLSLVFNQYVNPIALERMGWRLYIVYSAWLAVELVFIYFYLIETKNRTLEETAALFDGDDVVDIIKTHGGEITCDDSVKPIEVRIEEKDRLSDEKLSV